MTDYRDRLLAEAVTLQRHEKPLKLRTRENLRASLTRMFCPRAPRCQLWWIAWERNPELREVIATWWCP
jgi:hypothetical protein